MEPMGSEVYLHLTTENHAFIANVEPDMRPELGKPTDLIVNMDKAHFFDKATGHNLHLDASAVSQGLNAA
jgi:ABC-type sugar transport system ATPase subunit